MSILEKLKKAVLLGLAFAGSAQAGVITLPPTSEPEVIDIPGIFSVAWVHSFMGVGIGLPEEGGGNLCNQLAATQCAVNGSAAIQKRNFDDGVPGSIENGPLFTAGQTFTVTFDCGLPLDCDPFLGGNSDGVWSYNTAPALVTAWATKGGSDGYTVFYLVPDGDYELSPPPGYSGIAAPTGIALPFGTFRLDGEVIRSAALSNIIFFDSSTPLPPTGLPEPGTLLLLGATLAALGVIRRRRS